MAQFLLECLDHAAVLGDAAGHDELVTHTDPVGKPGNPVGDRVVDTVDDVTFVASLRKLADNLALRKDSAK